MSPRKQSAKSGLIRCLVVHFALPVSVVQAVLCACVPRPH